MGINNQRILITDFVHDRLLHGLQELGYIVDYQPEIHYKKIFSIIHDYTGIVINSKVKMTKELIELGSHLTFIARLGSGLDVIDLEAARENGVLVFSAPEGNRIAVGEHALGMLLALSNKLMHSHNEVISGNWDRESCRGFEINSKKIGIIGFGNNGSAFAKKLSGFDVEILAYDKYKFQYAHLYNNVKESTIEDIQKKADVISFHVPLNDETEHYFDDDFLKNCKKPIVIINTSRGRVIDTKTLISGLNTNAISGACIDVFENEKPKTYTVDESKMYKQLFSSKNVIFSPHVAGWTKESFFKISDSLLRQITDFDQNGEN